MASPLTVSGYPAAVQRGRYNAALMQGQAVNVVRTMLADGEDLDLSWLTTGEVDIPNNYVTPKGTVYGTPGAAGFTPTSTAPSAYNSGGGSGAWDWGGIIKNLFGAVGSVASAVSGKPPAPAKAALPSWAVPAAVGGVLLVGYLALRK